MKILIVTPGFYPAKNYGGPVISIANLVNVLSSKFDIYILTSNYEFKSNKRIILNNVGFLEANRAKIRYLDRREMKLKDIKKIINSIKPDVVYINSLFYYRLTVNVLVVCRLKRIRTIIAPRGGLCQNAIQFSKKKKYIYIFGLKISGLLKNVIYHSTSLEETESIQKWLNPKENNLVELTNIPAKINMLQHSTKRKNELRIIFFSRIHPKKNLNFALNCIQRLNNLVTMDIYGPIEDSLYWSKCQQTIRNNPPNVIVNYRGYLEHDDIPQVLSKYDLFFFPTLSENFGHVIAEALSSGCIVLLSNNTPWNDVNDYGVGRAIPLDNMNLFIEYLDIISNFNENDIQDIRNKIPSYLTKHYNIERVIDNYTNMFTRSCCHQ